MESQDFHGQLSEADGTEYTGYKGGQFRMDSTTPMWVANYGSSSGFEHSRQGVVGVTKYDDRVEINTAEVDF